MKNRIKQKSDSTKISQEFIKEITQQFESLKAERATWDVNFQLVAEYVWTSKADFTTEYETPGRFLNNNLYDTTAYDSMIRRASALKGMVWGNGEFRYVPVHDNIKEDEDAIKFFQDATDIVRADLSNPESNLEPTLFENELYDGSFGTSCLIISESNNNRVRFASLDLKEYYVDEDEFGNVDTLFRLYDLKVKQAVQKYGLEVLSESVQGKFNSKQYNEKIKFLHVIRPRKYKKTQEGVFSMPFESVHLEYAKKHLVKESGFNYKPFLVHRENKKTDEKYGRGPGFNTISDNKNLQTVTADLIHISNRYGDPPLAAINASATGDIIDKSPGGYTNFEVANSISKPIFNLVEEINGNIPVLLEFKRELQERITQQFNIDILLDFNNEKQMTAFETAQRASIRQQALGSKFTSRIVERYTPMLTTVFDIYFKNRRFGVTPNEAEVIRFNAQQKNLPIPDLKVIPQTVLDLMESRDEVYDVVYYTPQAQQKMLAESQTILTIYQNASLIAQATGDASVFDNLNHDEAIRSMENMTIISDLFRSKKEVEGLRADRQKMQDAQMALGAAKEGSEIQKNLSTTNNKEEL